MPYQTMNRRRALALIGVGLTSLAPMVCCTKTQNSKRMGSRKMLLDGSTVGTYTPPVQIGTPYGMIFTRSGFTDTNDFNTDGATGTATGGGIDVSGGDGITDFNSRLLLKGASGIEKWKISAQFKITAISATTYGIGIGKQSVSLFGTPSVCAKLNLADASNGGGRLQGFAGLTSPFTQVATSGSEAISYAVNDTVEITCELNINLLTITARNITNGAAALIINYFYPVVSPQVPNTGRFCVYVFGGTYKMLSYTVTSQELKNARLMVIGDSKSQLYNASSFANRYASLLNVKYPGVVVNSGGYDQTYEVLAKMFEIISFAPAKVLLNIGTNDKRTGHTFAEWQANYNSIVSQLEAVGITVYHLLHPAEGTLTFADYNTHITNLWPTKVINAGTVSLSSDQVHWDDTGHNQVFTAIDNTIGSII